MNTIFVEKPDGKWPFGKSTHTHEYTTKMILMETGYLLEDRMDSNISEINHVPYCYEYDKTFMVLKRRASA